MKIVIKIYDNISSPENFMKINIYSKTINCHKMNVQYKNITKDAVQ